MLLISLLTLAVLWWLTTVFDVVLLEDFQTLRFWMSGFEYDIALLEMFALAFAAMASLWFVDVMRYREGRRQWVRRGAEFLLIGCLLLTNVGWFGVFFPQTPGGRMIQSLPELRVVGVLFRPVSVMFEAGDRMVDPEPYYSPQIDYVLPRPPVSRFADPPNCLTIRQEELLLDRARILAALQEGLIDVEDADARLVDLPKSFPEPDWCPVPRERWEPLAGW